MAGQFLVAASEVMGGGIRQSSARGIRPQVLASGGGGPWPFSYRAADDGGKLAVWSIATMATFMRRYLVKDIFGLQLRPWRCLCVATLLKTLWF
jgi:hypothetical protein